MIAAKIGKTLLDAYNDEKGTQHNAKTFFEEVFFPLFYDHEKYLQWVTNSPFVQGITTGDTNLYGTELKKVKLSEKEKLEEQLNELKKEYGSDRIDLKTDRKGGQYKILLRNDTIQRAERLNAFVNKVSKTEPDSSIAIGFPSMDITATTSGQVTNLKMPFAEEEVYCSWIGGGLGIGIQGGLCMYFDNPKILMILYEGWSLYRNEFLNNSAYKKMRGNQIDTWNGQWLAHVLHKDFLKDHPLLDFNGVETTKDGTMELKTQNWLKILFGIAYQFPQTILTGYIFSLGSMNKTVGFIPFILPQITKPISLYKKLFGENEYLKNSKQIESIYGSEFGFNKCCEMGSIGLKALEPKGLKDYIFPTKEGKVQYPNYKKADNIKIISFHTYITWILAMLKNDSLWEKAETYAQSFIDYEGKDKKLSTGRSNEVEKVLSSLNRKGFIDALTMVVKKSDSQPPTFLELAKQVDSMPADNFAYFLTLVRFRYAYLKKTIDK